MTVLVVREDDDNDEEEFRNYADGDEEREEEEEEEEDFNDWAAIGLIIWFVSSLSLEAMKWQKSSFVP